MRFLNIDAINAKQDATDAVLGTMTTRTTELSNIINAVAQMVSDQLLSQFVDPPGGCRTGVQSPKPPCRATG